jgi:hypothetical protein
MLFVELKAVRRVVRTLIAASVHERWPRGAAVSFDGMLYCLQWKGGENEKPFHIPTQPAPTSRHGMP